MHTEISESETRIIYNASQSVLLYNDELWIKKKDSKSPAFDITMGGYHGAEVCELVGLFMLNEITAFVPKHTVGLYRDDGLMVIRKQTGFKTEKLKQKLHQFAKTIGLHFELEGPMKRTDFLDATLDLQNEIYRPYRKKNSEIRYVRSQSNHPSSIIRQIPKMIGNRISKRSNNQEVFKEAATDYNKALQDCGYKETINYEPAAKKKSHSRKRKKIWYNPPFCKTVKTKLAKKFMDLVKKIFNKNNPLSKIFNKNSISLSYSCMPNIGTKINGHNKKILQEKQPQANETKPCNCTKFECPLKDSELSCRTESVVYQATVKSENNIKSYIGLTEKEFKTRWYQHRHDFNSKQDSTELSKHVWELKKTNKDFEIRWKILKQVPKLRNGQKMCRLCTTEALLIIKNGIKNGNNQLNTRNEIMNKCRHQNKFLLKNWKGKEKIKKLKRP